MSSLGPDAVVQQPLLTPPSIGLLSSANVVDETGERWVNGLAYAPEGCGDAEVFDLCATFSKTVSAAGGPITGTPFGAVAQDTCNTFSRDERDYKARAYRKLLAMESYLIEKELWDGALGLNPFLTSNANPVKITATASTLLTAIGNIEQAAFDAMPGKRIMIHMRPLVLDLIAAVANGPLLRYEGGRYYTANNSIVVPGRGYSGKAVGGGAPNATTESIFATSLVDVRHGPVFYTPGSLDQAMDRQTNQVTYFAERAVHASFDYNCAVVTCVVTKTITGP